MQNQLPLSLKNTEISTFDNFISGDNQQLISSLHNKNEKLIFIWGDNNTGKSHLLQALVNDYQVKGKNALYFPLQIDEDFSPHLFDGLELMDLVCLDTIQNIVGQDEWEVALFHFFNKIRENNGRLVLASHQNAVNLELHLADLKSRLSWGLTYQTITLSDHDKIKLLKLRAYERGVDMNDSVAQYLLTHTSREVSDLIQLLEKLDYASLAEQRKLTIPFIKDYLL